MAVSGTIPGSEGCASGLLPKLCLLWRLQLLYPDLRTFFAPVGELGVAYHETHYVSGLPYGEFPYEERFPISGELVQWTLILEFLETY